MHSIEESARSMKSFKRDVVPGRSQVAIRNYILSGITLLLIAGCNRESKDEFRPIGNGFGYDVRAKGWIHRRVAAGLQYRDSAGKMAVVWPYLSSASPAVQIANNLAVLIGGKAERYDDGVERLTERLIAFESPTGPPMDITDQVLNRWCRETGVQFTNVIKDSFVSLNRTNNLLQIDFGIVKRNLRGSGSVDAADGTAIFSWSDIKAITQDVKKTGHLHKEKWSGIEYLQKD